jgi:hypothetical protein
MAGILWAVIQSPLLIQRRYTLGKADHITLQYGVNLEDWQHLLGVEFTATCLYEAWNSNIQCVAVSLPESIPCANLHPHITVSWKPGISPVKSNTMLASKFNYQLLNLQVKCKIEFIKWTNPD